jgi:hypothetical protein
MHVPLEDFWALGLLHMAVAEDHNLIDSILADYVT